MKAFKTVADEIKKAKNIILLSHIAPDGDSLGSVLALYGIITQLYTKEKLDMVIVGKIPDVYLFLPEVNKVKIIDDESLYQSYDLAIALDCGAIDRLGEAVEFFKNAKTTINIDHHISNNSFAEINIVDTEAAATGEIIFELTKTLQLPVTKDIATSLYTSILTDTGGFKFDNTRPATFEMAATLQKTGIKPGFIYKRCYESKPLQMIRLHARCVDNAIITSDNKIAYTFISRALLNELKATDDHVDGISESLRQINTIDVAMALKETNKGYTKISFRSKKTDVCQIAKFFGGGGHKLAAGCTIEKNLADALNEILPIVKKQVNKKSQ